MPGPVVHLGATVTCAHGGTATPTAPQPRVQLSGQFLVTTTIPHAVAGCSLAASGNPPCVSGLWTVGSVRVTSMGLALAIQTGTSTCAPTGTPFLAVVVQPRVFAT